MASICSYSGDCGAFAWDCDAGCRPSRSLREAAQDSGMLIGTAVRPAQLSEPAYASTLAREFNMLEPEDALKWEVVHPERAVFRFFPSRPDCGLCGPARHEGSRPHAGLAPAESRLADGGKIHLRRSLPKFLKSISKPWSAITGERFSPGMWSMRPSTKLHPGDTSQHDLARPARNRLALEQTAPLLLIARAV